MANAAEHARSRVAVSCDVAGGHLVIEVADDGPGFSPAALERGCERLFTDDSSRSSRDGGRHYGLGLHVASEAASAHGGSVSLANSPSGGAVVTIAVPCAGSDDFLDVYLDCDMSLAEAATRWCCVCPIWCF